MRAFFALLLLPVAAILGQPAASNADGNTCSEFNDGTTQGWYAGAATVWISSPGPDGSPYLRCGDLPSPPTSSIFAPASYHGSWEDLLALEFEFILHDDGWSGEAHPLSPVLHLKASPLEDVGERAVFFIDAPVTDPDGGFPGWHHIVAPVHPVTGPDLPSGPSGHWVIPVPIVDPVTDWNHLLEDVQMFRFIADIAGSPTQAEDFGLDSVCLVRDQPVSVDPMSWGRLKSRYIPPDPSE